MMEKNKSEQCINSKMKEVEQINVIQSFGPGWISEKKLTHKFFPPHMYKLFMLSHCIIKALPGGKKQTCLYLHL